MVRKGFEPTSHSPFGSARIAEGKTVRVRVATVAAGFLLLYLFALILTPAPFFFLSGLSFDEVLLFAGALSMLMIAWPRFLVFGELRARLLHAAALMAPVFAVFAMSAFSLFVSDAVRGGFEDLQELTLQTLTLFLALYLANRACISGSPTKLLKKVVLLVSFASIIGIVFTLSNITPLDFIRSLGLPTVERVEVLLSVREVRFSGFERAQGFFTHPIEYGATLVLAYAVVRVRPDIVRPGYVRWSIYLILLLGVLFSGSRSAWLGIVITEVMVRYLNSERSRRALIVTVATWLILVLLALNLDQITSAVADIRSSADPLDTSIAARLADYQFMFETVQEHPAGVGYSNWHEYAQGHSADPVNNMYLDNDYLRFLAEGGVLGLLVYLLFVFRGLLPLPYAFAKHERFLVIVLTLSYAWQAYTFDAFAFGAYTLVHAVLLAIALRLPKRHP